MRTLGLESTTDIIIAADHGFSTISKQSQTSAAVQYDFAPGVPAKSLPPGFLVLDLAPPTSWRPSDRTSKPGLPTPHPVSNADVGMTIARLAGPSGFN